MKKHFYFILTTLFFLFNFSCKKKVINVDKNIQPISAIKYAKGFDIINDNGVKKLIIKAAYQNSDEVFEYEIHKKTLLKKVNTDKYQHSNKRNSSHLNNTYSHG